MKYQIRKSVWESNSSSMHSLVVTKKNANIRMTQEEIRKEQYLDEPWKKNSNVWNLNFYGDNYFGRSPFECLCTFTDKLRYAVAEYCGDCYGIKSYIEAEKKFDDMFRELVLNLTGCDDIEIDYNTNYFRIYADVPHEYMDEAEEVPYKNLVYNEDRKDGEDTYKDHDINGRPIEIAYFEVPRFGGIDHASSGLLRRFLEENDISIADFLIRKDIICVVDGDEYCIFGSMINCGLVDKDNIVYQTNSSNDYEEEGDNE